MKQCTELIAKRDFVLKPTKGRAWNVKQGQKFWVTSPVYNNITSCTIDRVGKGWPNSGLYLTLHQIYENFYVEPVQ